MPAPINYMGMIERPDLAKKFLTGMQIGDLFVQDKLRKEAAIKQQQQEEQARALKEQYSSDLQAVMQNPTTEGFAGLVSKYPQQREALSQSFDMLNKEQQQNEIRTTSQVYSALVSGNTDVATRIIDQHITALENSGKDPSKLMNIKTAIEADPKAASSFVGLTLASLMGPEKFSSTFKAIGEERRAEQEQPFKIEEFLDKKENTRLRALEAELRKADSELKRKELQLKIDKLRDDATTRAKDKISEASGALETFDRTIGTIEKIMTHPGLETATGLTSFMSILPGTEARDVSALIDTLESQAFTAEVQKMKGLGALSESEGKKLSAAVANLDRGQSTEAFRSNLKTALDIFTNARDRAVSKYSNIMEQKTEAEQGTTETTSPNAGDEMDGYRFKGGDPANPNNWEKI